MAKILIFGLKMYHLATPVKMDRCRLSSIQPVKTKLTGTLQIPAE
jgi:hypothetical protein